MHETKKLSLWARLHVWIAHHHLATYAIAAGGVLLASIIVGIVVFYKQPQKIDTPAPVVVKKQAPPAAASKFYSPLTGEEVADQAATTLPATGIMIENSPNARPQSGLKSAGVVFEAIAEGGITRFLALYQQKKPQIAGPVRSIRLYDAQWLVPFDASIAHVGGSREGLAEVRNGKYRDIDQFFNAGSYWRSSDRYAPHNVYTNFTKLDALNKAKGYTSSNVKGFSRKDASPAKTPNATKINVIISSSLYNSSYVYDAASNSYPRSQAGAPHNDREEGQITPKVVVVLNVDERTVLQDGYREQITTVGSGKATVFQDGTVTVGTWHKPSASDQLTFTDNNGKDIPLDRGQTWLTAIPNGRGSVSWQ